MSTLPDVVVLGSGAAGLMCALTTAQRGASTLVVEASAVIGGTSAISGGALWIPGSLCADPEDSSADVERYLRAITLGLVSEDLLRGFIDSAPRALSFLEQHSAITFESAGVPDYVSHAPGSRLHGRSLGPSLYDTKRLGDQKSLVREVNAGGIPPITHAEQRHGKVGVDPDLAEVVATRRAEGIAGRGNALIGALLESCLKSGVQFRRDARGVRLIHDHDRVAGVVVADGSATETVYVRQGVVLATGGYEWDERLWNGLTGKPLDCPLSPPYNRGDALRMAVSAGARLEHTSMAWWMPSIRLEGEEVDGAPAGRMFMNDKGLPGAIAVNPSGRRFANEAMNYHDFGLAMTTFDPHTFSFANLPTWVVMDERHYQTYGLHMTSAQFGEGWLTSAPTLRALAEKIGVDGPNLEDEVQRFNAAAEQHVDPVFHRGETAWDVFLGDPSAPNPALGALESGPYHAYRQYVGVLGTKGGAAVDGNGRVLDFDDRPIPGLFAIGNAAAALFGPSYPGAGATLGAAVTGGHMAGLALTS